MQRIGPRGIDPVIKRRETKGARRPPIRPGRERRLDLCSEWLIQDHGMFVTYSLAAPILMDDDDVVEMGLCLRAVQWLYAITEAAPLENPSLSATH